MDDEKEIVELVNGLIRCSYAREAGAKTPDKSYINEIATILLVNLGIENFHLAEYEFEEQGFKFKCPQVFLNRYHE